MIPRLYRILFVPALSCTCFVFGTSSQTQTVPDPITREMVASAEKLIGLNFTDVKRDSMLDGLKEQLDNYEKIRNVQLPNSVPPAILFNSIPTGMKFDPDKCRFSPCPAVVDSVKRNLTAASGRKPLKMSGRG